MGPKLDWKGIYCTTTIIRDGLSMKLWMVNPAFSDPTSRYDFGLSRPFSGKNLGGSLMTKHLKPCGNQGFQGTFSHLPWNSMRLEAQVTYFSSVLQFAVAALGHLAPKRGSSAKPVGLLADRSKDCTDQSRVRFHFDDRDEQSKLPWFYVVLLLQQIWRWINPWVSATWVVLTGCLLHEIDCYNQEPCLLECPGRWIDTRPAYLRLTQLQCICKFVSQC